MANGNYSLVAQACLVVFLADQLYVYSLFRLCAIADGLAGKVSLLHGGSAPYDITKSKIPLLQQTSSQEMATIVNNLRHVEMQLLRADELLDPSHKLRELLHE